MAHPLNEWYVTSPKIGGREWGFTTDQLVRKHRHTAPMALVYEPGNAQLNNERFRVYTRSETRYDWVVHGEFDTLEEAQLVAQTCLLLGD